MLIAPVVVPMCATTLTLLLGRPPGGILLRDPSAAEQISCRSLQKRCDHHVLSAADQQERPTAVNKWSYLHVDQLPRNFTALYLMNNFDRHVSAATIWRNLN
jgi:hypothetical protein